MNERRGWGIISKVKRGTQKERSGGRESREKEREERRKEKRQRNICATLHLKCVNAPQISVFLLLYVFFTWIQ